MNVLVGPNSIIRNAIHMWPIPFVGSATKIYDPKIHPNATSHTYYREGGLRKLQNAETLSHAPILVVGYNEFHYHSTLESTLGIIPAIEREERQSLRPLIQIYHTSTVFA